MRLRNFDLALVIFVIMLNIMWTQLPFHLTLVGIVLGLPLTLFLPGYALVQVLFRRQGHISNFSSGPIRRPELKIGHPIGISDQIVLSLGLSMAIDILVGFGLNILPMGLQALSWVFSLGLLTIVFAVAAIFLRRKDTPRVAKSLQIRISWQEFVLFALAILVVASAVWLAIIRPLNPQPSYTQFWILPVNYANKGCDVSVGLQSFETLSETYRVVLTANNAKTKTNKWSSIVLAPQQKWVQVVTLVPDTGPVLYVNARLYRTDKPSVVYRNVHLTFNVVPTNLNGHMQKKCISGV